MKNNTVTLMRQLLWCCVLIVEAVVYDVRANVAQELSAIKHPAHEFRLLDSTYDHDNIVVCKFLEAQKSSYIVFIKDHEENEYIVKQERGKTLKNQFRSISETLCAYIANEVSIPSHHVRLLPINNSFPGKFITKRLATVHTVVPGCTIRTLLHDEYAKLDIKQPVGG